MSIFKSTANLRGRDTAFIPQSHACIYYILSIEQRKSPDRQALLWSVGVDPHLSKHVEDTAPVASPEAGHWSSGTRAYFSTGFLIFICLLSGEFTAQLKSTEGCRNHFLLPCAPLKTTFKKITDSSFRSSSFFSSLGMSGL